MVSIYDLPPGELINKAAEKLKEIEVIQPPEWSNFVKTGVHKERPPVDDDWWYIRVAAVLRSVYRLGPVGVQKLRTKYGGKKNRGVKPGKFYKGSGSVIRKALQQLENAELVVKSDKDIHKGRVITGKGKSLLDKSAVELMKEKPAVKKEAKPEVKKEEPKVEAKKEEAKPEVKKEEPKAETKA